MKAKLGLFKNAYADPKKAAKTVGCEKHRKISMQVAGKSVTLFKNKKKTIPLKLNYTQRVLVITTLAKKLVPTTDPIQCPEMLLNAIKKNHPNAQGHFTTMSPTAQDISKCVELAKNADVVIMATANAILRSQQAALIKALVKELNSLKKPLVVVAMQSPHDIVEFPGIDTYLCTYELANDCMLAASDIIFGLCKPSGKLPVKIK
ncbi:MAG: hypothetical protein A2297_04890 [Elusimicrobia bacterium RIFOXYB2_FULL_48_7]|nr:MAG: hypothetical protein A2297_04890 [Elusimicrobia bacterium RIFOXYB2_FULL_48_7]